MDQRAQEHKEIVHRALEALEQKDRETFMRLHAEDVVLHDGGRDIRGREALADHEWSFLEAFPDAEFTIEDLIAEGDRVALRHTMTGTHRRTFQGMEPTGITVRVPVMILFRFEENHVVEVWVLADRLGLLEQLGARESEEA